MILHLGKDCFVPSGSILMILDYEEAERNEDTSFCLGGIPQKRISDHMQTRSVVITQKDGEIKKYLSPISHQTLFMRSQQTNDNVEMLYGD